MCLLIINSAKRHSLLDIGLPKFLHNNRSCAARITFWTWCRTFISSSDHLVGVYQRSVFRFAVAEKLENFMILSA